MLVEFQRARGQLEPDCYEKIANFLLRPLRLASGRVVEVHTNPRSFQEKVISRTCQIVNRVLFTLSCLCVLPLFFFYWTGFVCSKLSTSYKKLCLQMESHTQSKGNPLPIARKLLVEPIEEVRGSQPSSIEDHTRKPVDYNRVKKRLEKSLLQKKDGTSLPSVLPEGNSDLWMKEVRGLYGDNIDVEERYLVEERKGKVVGTKPFPTGGLLRDRFLKEQRQEIEQTVMPALDAIVVPSSTSQPGGLQEGGESGRFSIDPQAIKNLIRQLIKLENRERFHNLHNELRKTFSSQEADEWLTDAAIVGENVVADNAILSEKQALKIVEMAKKVKAAKETLASAKKELSQYFPAEIVYAKYWKEISSAGELGLPSTADLNEEFRNLINSRIIHTELQLKNNQLKGKGFETEVLLGLGYTTPDRYDSFEIVKTAMLSLIPELHKTISLSGEKPSMVRILIQQAACKKRLELAGVQAEDISWVYKLIGIVAKAYQRGYVYIDSIGVEHEIQGRFPREIQEKFPDFVAQVGRSKVWHLRSFVRGQLKSWMKNLNQLRSQGGLQTQGDIETETRTFHQGLIKQIDKECRSIVNPSAESLKMLLSWVEIFIPDDVQVVEYQQGQDGDGTVLGDGVCAGLVYNMYKKLLHNPGSSLQDLRVNEVPNSARFNQASYATGVRLRASKSGFSNSLLNRDGLKRENIVLTEKPEDRGIDYLIAEVIESIGARSEKRGFQAQGFDIGIFGPYGGHALYIGFDEADKRAIFYDPNFFAVEKRFQDRQDGLEWLYITLLGVIAYEYSNTSHMTVSIYHKKGG